MKKAWKISALAVPALVGLGLGAGLLREVVLAYVFGASREIEIFRVAFGLPSILSDSLAVSFVSVLIPIILAGERGRPIRAMQSTIWAAVLVASVVFVVGIVTMPLQARLLAPGIDGANRVLLIGVGQACWIMFLFVILSLPLRAVLSTKGTLWPSASSQLLRSGAFVIFLGFALYAVEENHIIAAAVAAPAAGAAVLAAHVFALGRRDRQHIWLAVRSRPAFNPILPIVGSLGSVFVAQIFWNGGRLLDRSVASTMTEGSLAAIEYSYAIIMAVAALIATTSNIILGPKIGRALMHGNALPGYVKLHVMVITGFAGITGVLIAMYAMPLVALLLERGAFTATATALTARVLALHALALGPLVLALLLAQFLILTKKHVTLIGVAIAKLTLKALSLWLLVKIGLEIDGIAASLTIAEVAGSLALFFIIIRRPEGKRKQ